jgi:S-adenosylmethionine:tRNA ribosyltransferase-isomerase
MTQTIASVATSTEFEALLARYDYPIAPDRIALEPAVPRDSSKLLIYDRSANAVHEDTFEHIVKYLPPGAVLLFNDTKVVPARLPGTVTTGGRVELLCTSFSGSEITALCERYLKDGERIRIADSIAAIVLGKNGSEYSLRIDGTDDIKPLLQSLGIPCRRI